MLKAERHENWHTDAKIPLTDTATPLILEEQFFRGPKGNESISKQTGYTGIKPPGRSAEAYRIRACAQPSAKVRVNWVC